MKILLLEEDRTLSNSIKGTLERHGFSVSCALSDENGRGSAFSGLYDMVIINESSVENSFRLAAEIRKERSKVYVIVIGIFNSVEERSACLNSGADYCISLSNDMRELIACINAIARRNYFGSNELSVGNTYLELSSCQLVCGEKRVRLSSKEFDVMRILLYSKNSVLPKEAILANVWGGNSDASDNHVEVYVGFLRRKLASIGSDVTIKSLRRLGYFLEENDMT